MSNKSVIDLNVKICLFCVEIIDTCNSNLRWYKKAVRCIAAYVALSVDELNKFLIKVAHQAHIQLLLIADNYYYLYKDCCIQ